MTTIKPSLKLLPDYVPGIRPSTLTRAERETHGVLERAGFVLLRHGWPDFLAIGYRTFGVEVKDWGDTVSERQAAMHDALLKAGIPTLVVSGNTLKGTALRLSEIPQLTPQQLDEILRGTP